MGDTYRPDQLVPEATVKRFIKQDEVQTVANQQLMESMQGLGVDIPYLIDKRKDAIKGAEENKQFSAMIKGIEGFEELAGLRNKVKIVQKQTQNYDYSKHLPPAEQQEADQSNSGKDKNE